MPRPGSVRFELPTDHVVTDRVEEGTAHEVLAIGDAAIGDRLGVDIGPATIDAYRALIGDAKTVVWNGPMGVFEIEAFATGTNAVARAVAEVQGTTIIGGGDSIAAVKQGGNRRPHLAHFDRRRRVARIPRGPHAPGVAALTDK